MSGRPTVLIVDDDEQLTDLYTYHLREAYDVRTASDGERALDALDDDVDVVFLDRRMPGVDGSAVLAEIRRRKLPARVAMVSAVTPDFDIVEMPFDTYLTKPVSGEELRETAARLHSLREADETARDLFSVTEKKAALERAKLPRELAAQPAYSALARRAATLSDVGANVAVSGED